MASFLPHLLLGSNNIILVDFHKTGLHQTENTHVCKAALVALMRFLSVIFSSINKALVS